MTPARAAELIARNLAALEVVAQLRPLEQREIDGVRLACVALVGACVRTFAEAATGSETKTRTRRA